MLLPCNSSPLESNLLRKHQTHRHQNSHRECEGWLVDFSKKVAYFKGGTKNKQFKNRSTFLA